MEKFIAFCIAVFFGVGPSIVAFGSASGFWDVAFVLFFGGVLTAFFFVVTLAVANEC